jgi:hypothetical protein
VDPIAVMVTGSGDHILDRRRPGRVNLLRSST